MQAEEINIEANYVPSRRLERWIDGFHQPGRIEREEVVRPGATRATAIATPPDLRSRSDFIGMCQKKFISD